MNTLKNFSVLGPVAFLDDVTREAKHAKKRFWAQAMEVESGTHTKRLIQSLQEVGGRGVDTRLQIDHYSYMVTDGVFNYWPFVSSPFRRERNKRLRMKQHMRDTLREAGVTVRLINPPTFLDRLIPTRGRNHMKIVLIDDVAWIGGVNFHEKNFVSEDVMIRISDPAISAEIAYIYELIGTEELQRDMKITCTDETSILVDSGRIHHSLILRHAKEMVLQARDSIKMISLLIPDAAFLAALKKARVSKRKITIIVPNIAVVEGIYQLVDRFNNIVMRLRGISLPILYKSFPVHAKILIVDEEIAIVGSHNFSSRGVRMGTEEIALQSTDPILVKALIEYFTHLEKKKKTETKSS